MSIPVHYRSWLTEQAEAALVFLHGFGEHSGLPERLAGPLNARAIDLWSLDPSDLWSLHHMGDDAPGGEPSSAGSFNALAADARRLAAVAQEHDPGLPVFIAGHGLGGVGAAMAVTRDPSAWSGAVLCGTPIDPPDWVERALDWGEGGLAHVAAGLALDQWSLSAPTIDLLAFAEGAGSPLHRLEAAWVELAERFSAVRLPVLFVHGQDDRVAPVAGARWWVKQLKSALLVEFPSVRRDILNVRMHAEIAAWVVEQRATSRT